MEARDKVVSFAGAWGSRKPFKWERALFAAFDKATPRGSAWCVGGRYAGADWIDVLAELKSVKGCSFADPWQGKPKYVARGVAVNLVLPTHEAMLDGVTARAFYRRLGTAAEKSGKADKSVWFVSDMREGDAWARAAVLEVLSPLLATGTVFAIFHVEDLSAGHEGVPLDKSLFAPSSAPLLSKWNDWLSGAPLPAGTTPVTLPPTPVGRR